MRSALRPLRAAVFSVVCVALTALGHGLAEGHAVGPGALCAGLFAVFAPALACARHERSQSVITAGVLVGEVGLHLLFTLVQRPSAVSMPGHMGSSAHPDHGAAPALMPMGPGIAIAGHRELAMLVGHLGAGVLVGWWLRRGEAACWRLLRRAESLVTAAVRIALVLVGVLDGPGAHRDPVSIPRPARHGPQDRTTVLLTYCAPRRGPPRALRAA